MSFLCIFLFDLDQSSSHIATSPREDGSGIKVLMSGETKEKEFMAAL